MRGGGCIRVLSGPLGTFTHPVKSEFQMHNGCFFYCTSHVTFAKPGKPPWGTG